MPTVLVVGATRGIGLEFVRQYAADGARVIATFRRPQDAEVLRALGARALPLDALDPDSIAALAQGLESAQGKLAAISSRRGSIGLATDTNSWLYRASKAALNSVVKTASIH